MAFIALGIEKLSLIQQKSEMEYELMVAADNLNYVTDEIKDVEKAYGDDTDGLDNDQDYQDLKDYEEEYTLEKESLNSQLEELNGEIKSFGEAVDNNIKNDCKLSIST